MKSAAWGSQLDGFGWVVAIGAAVVLLAAAPAEATSPPNPCFTNTLMYTHLFVGDSVGSGLSGLDHCSPATEKGGIGAAVARDYTNQMKNALGQTFFNRYAERNERSPLHAFFRRSAIDMNSATRLALLADGERDLAAGYTPHETTGEFIQRWLQPLRDHNVSTWLNTSWTSPRDTHRPTRYDSDVWTLTWGADMPVPQISEDLLVGVFGSYTNSDVDTTFNKGDVESKLGTVGPYFVYTLNDYIGFDTTVGAIFGQQENVVGSPVRGFRDARGEQDVDGFFVALNANASYWLGNWGVNGRLGFLHSDVETESYDLGTQTVPFPKTTVRVPGTNSELTQIAVAAQVNYFYDGGIPFCDELKVMPFFRVTWNYDLDHENIQLPRGVSQHPNDDDEVVLNWGMTLFGNGPVSGSFEAGRTFARSRYEAWSLTGTLSYAF